MRTLLTICGLSGLMLAVMASEVTFSSLQEALPEARLIFSATTLQVEEGTRGDVFRVDYLVRLQEILHGTVPRDSTLHLAFTLMKPVIRDLEGEIVATFSPFLKSSGAEFSVEADEQWIFLISRAEPVDSLAIPVLRVEPVSRMEEIRMWIRHLESPESSLEETDAPK